MTKKMVMPWEDRPAGCADVMWRYSKNPVIDRYHIPSSNSIVNLLKTGSPECSVAITKPCK